MADPTPEERAEKLWTEIPESERAFFPIKFGHSEKCYGYKTHFEPTKESAAAAIREAEAAAFKRGLEEAAKIARKFRPPCPGGMVLSEAGEHERHIQWHTAEEIARDIERAKEAPRG